ncbi:MAG: hypothetical protein ABW148_02145 [Sedimenticola sp.]
MKTPILIKKAKKLLNANKDKHQNQVVCIKVVLKKLKKKELSLKNRLAKEKGEKNRKKTLRDLKIITAQRKKGLSIMSRLKEK